ncbi:MAG: hypothetical protein Q8R25_02905 [bacterium]|nr:hypothetical protein [bacterium]
MAHPKKVAIVFGLILAAVHVVWVTLVALSWAQPLVDFSLWAHMVNFPVVVGSFDVTAAVTVIVVAFLIGSTIGYVGATIWNKVKH